MNRNSSSSPPVRERGWERGQRTVEPSQPPLLASPPTGGEEHETRRLLSFSSPPARGRGWERGRRTVDLGIEPQDEFGFLVAELRLHLLGHHFPGGAMGRLEEGHRPAFVLRLDEGVGPGLVVVHWSF